MSGSVPTPVPDRALRLLASGQPANVSAAELHDLLVAEPGLANFARANPSGGFELLSPRAAGDHRHELTSDGSGDPDVLKDLRSVLARHDLASTRRSVMARALRSTALPGGTNRRDALNRADRLDRLVGHWLRQRLWSINLAPELVAHDERHVAAVEDLITSLALPFLDGSKNLRISPLEAEWLAVSAWLHDWGHVGGPVMAFRLGDRYPMLSTSKEVRLLHGLISQQLLGEHWRGMHDVPPEVSQPAAVMCGHHQSWTSFGSEVPAPSRGDAFDPVAVLHGLDLRPISLSRDVESIEARLPSHIRLRRFQLLVAMLRVADGADVGRHRVADLGPARQSFLARCLHREALRTAAALAANPRDPTAAHDGIAIALGVAVEAMHAATADQFENRLSDIVDHDIAEIAALSDYATFIRKQEHHFRKHQLVDAVRFEHVGGRFDAVVVPTVDGADASRAAVGAVAADMRRELQRSHVGQVLADFGIEFRVARSAGPEGWTEPI